MAHSRERLYQWLRVRQTNSSNLHTIRPHPRQREEPLGYHDKDHTDSLSRYVMPLHNDLGLTIFLTGNRDTSRNQNDTKHLIDDFICGEDCPILKDMFDFCCVYAGSSLAAVRKLCAGTPDIAINWSGGLETR
jgi:acetoin utilization deacetylase AcuC-like enzyme